ncbi:ankyrin-2-like [Harmonia axyridis]|uniref:ankyrin-2-like n=1 Tax=Harmonia axyridis TaxID=115357 RepID=UPI001E279A85|nr:ankyrin-2-like [Harmonia axyridis]
MMDFLESITLSCFGEPKVENLEEAVKVLSYKQLKRYLKRNYKKIKKDEISSVFASLYIDAYKQEEEFHELFTLLLRYGADPLYLYDYKETILYRSITCGVPALTKEFLQFLPNIDCSIEDQGKTALHAAALSSCKEIMLYVLEMGADVNARTENKRFTPLHVATTQADPEVIDILLDHGADINARNGHGETPLHMGFPFGNRKVLSHLINRGTDLNARDKFHKTALHQFLHRWAGCVEICELLLKNGADPMATDDAGNTALHSLALSCRLSKLYPSIALTRMLVEAGVDINAQNREGQTPMHVAITKGMDRSYMLCLLRSGADIVLPDIHGFTVLQYYLLMNSKSGLELLRYYALEERKGKFQFTEDMLNQIEKNEKYQTFLLTCTSELSTLASMSVGNESSFTLLDFLIAPISIAARFSQNEEFAKLLDKINSSNFPCYSHVLAEKYRKGCRRGKAETIGFEFLNQIFDGVLNAVCIKAILDYIPTQDLERLKYSHSNEVPKESRDWMKPDYFKKNLGHYFDQYDP